MKQLSLCFSFFLFICPGAVGQQINIENLGLNPPSVHWKKINTPAGKIIYPKGLDSIAFRTAGIMNYQRVNDRDIVGSGRAKRVPVILQNLTIFPEGFSTPAPWRNEYFITPPQDMFQGPAQWTDLLTIHEYRHTQQFHMAKDGFTWVFKPLAGQTGWLLSTLVNEPLWFREGDAVSTETLLTKGGRGRLPWFNKEFRAILLSGYKFNYEKASYGISLKDYVPNPYRAGFYMTSKLRKDFDTNIWQKILFDTYHKGLVYSFNHALKKNTGLSSTQLYNETMSELDSFWRKEDANLMITPSRTLTQLSKNNYTNYRFPHFLPDGSILCLKDAFDQVRTFTIINRDGSEKKLFAYGVYTEDHLMIAAEGNLVSWAEAAYDPRWGNKTYSVIKVCDVTTGRTKKLSSRTRYFAPCPSHDNDKIATIKIDLLNQSSLVILESKNGDVVKEWLMPRNLFIAQPRWSENDKEIYVVATTNRGNSIISINVETGERKILVPETTATLARPITKAGYLYFSGGYSGIDNIYALQAATGKIFQVSSVRFGAIEPTISVDGKKLIYSGYTANGYQLEEIDLDPSLWKEINETILLKPSQPYISSIQSKEITGLEFPASYKPQKYHALTSGLFNVYGWFPFIGVDQYGVQFLTQNIMNTLRGSITPFYNSNEKALGVKLDLNYAALYPIIHVGAGYQVKRGADIYDTSLRYLYRQSWKEKYYQAGLIFPFNLTQGAYLSQLTVSGEYEHYDIDFLDSLNSADKFRHMRFNAWSAQFEFSRFFQKARRQVQPRWGQALLVRYHAAVNDVPEQFLTSLRLYFPGILSTHSLHFTGQYREEKVVNTYRFMDNSMVMPRGYDVEPFDHIYLASADYELPIWYPDISAGGLAFFQQLRTKLFFDYSIASRTEKDLQLNSTGAELLVDLRALRLFGMTVGVRYSVIFNKGVVNTTPFQFFISRFELQN